MSANTQAEKAAEFLKLHRGPGPLVLANVWDVMSARLIERAGFPAIATSSAAIANALGFPDGEAISREAMLSVVARIAAKVSVPVSADLEAGYGTSLGEIAKTARALVAAGAVGLNFEDANGDAKNPLFRVAEQMEKIKCLRSTGEKLGVHFVINGRTDVYLKSVGTPATRFEHAVTRLNSYRQAGADCLFAPGVHDAETIGRLVKAVDGPLNILAGPATPPIAELARLGVARVSFGSWPARAALGLFSRFARELIEKGTFTTLGDWAIPYDELNQLMS